MFKDSSTIIRVIPPTRIRERHSIEALCPRCSRTVRTRVVTHSSTETILVAIALCYLITLLFFIPFVIPWCQETTHYCPHCNHEIGTVRTFSLKKFMVYSSLITFDDLFNKKETTNIYFEIRLTYIQNTNALKEIKFLL